MSEKTIISTEKIIINLLKEDATTYLAVKRLFKLESFICKRLREYGELNSKYVPTFDVSFDSIERTVMYHNKIFDLDINCGVIYLKEKVQLDSEEYFIDERITSLIKEFRTAG